LSLSRGADQKSGDQGQYGFHSPAIVSPAGRGSQ
jgi:hypothetical protein